MWAASYGRAATYGIIVMVKVNGDENFNFFGDENFNFYGLQIFILHRPGNVEPFHFHELDFHRCCVHGGPASGGVPEHHRI